MVGNEHDLADDAGVLGFGPADQRDAGGCVRLPDGDPVGQCVDPVGEEGDGVVVELLGV